MSGAGAAFEAGAEFVGREAELGALLAALEQARAGRGALFLIAGEPGIGKSRLAAEFAARARQADAYVLWGRAWEGGGAPPYWPWLQPLRAHLRNVDLPTARQQLGRGAADVAQIMPEIRDMIGDVPPTPPDSDASRFQLFDSTTAFLRNLSQERATLVVLDDLHAADIPSVLLLSFLASQLGDMRMVVVATYRELELSPDNPIARALVDVTREPMARVMTLSGLGRAEVGRLVRASTGHQPTAQLATGLWRETRGNPLFLAEAARLLVTEGQLGDPTAGEGLRVSLPASVREAITRRVKQLGEAGVRALELAAAVGPEFSAELLHRIGEYGPGQLPQLLGEAEHAGLVTPASSGRYRFSHNLVREALYEGLAPAERGQLHRRIAESLEQLHGHASEAHLAQVADHYYQAVQAGLDGSARSADILLKASDHARRAADQALSALAFEEAARRYQATLDLLDAQDSTQHQTRLEIILSLADASARAGDLLSARPRFLEAAALASRIAAPEQLAHAAIGYSGRFFWARAGDDPHVIRLLQDALVLLGSGNERLRVRLLIRLATAWRSSREHFEQSAALSQQALEIARQLDDPATLSYAMAGRFWATYWPETTAERHELAKQLVAVAEAGGEAERIIDGHTILFISHSCLGRMAEARAELETVIRLARELRQPAQLWLGATTSAVHALLEGDFSNAEQLIEQESARDAPVTPIRDDVSGMRMHRFLLRREQGRVEEEENNVRRSIVEFPWYPAHRAALVLLLADGGRQAEARAWFADLAADRFIGVNHDNYWLLNMCLLSESAVLLGEAAAAEEIYRQLSPFAGLHAIVHPEGSVGAVDRYLGLLAHAVGRLDDAAQHLADAVAMNDKMGARPWAAHSRADLARVLRARREADDVNRAAELQHSALATARELGMVLLERRLGDAPTAHEGSLPTTSDASVESRATGTFRREGEYWTIAFGPDSFRLRDAKGLHYLARLLAEPGRELLALDLARQMGPAAGPAPAEAGLSIGQMADAGAHLDDEAKRAYRQRLHELQSELDEAESWNDPDRAERARGEMEFLVHELARAVGLGGRDRTAGSPAERARQSVTRAIRLSMDRIAGHSASLAEHLETTVHTGTYCAYRPESRAAVRWEL